MKKKLLSTAILTLTVLACTACGGNDESDSTTKATDKVAETQQEKDVVLSDVCKEVLDKGYYPEMYKEEDADYIANYYGLTKEDAEDMIFYLPEDYLQADCLIIVKADSSEAADDLKDKFDKINENKKDELRDYNAAEYAKVEAAKIDSVGKYAYMVVTEKSGEAADLVESLLK